MIPWKREKQVDISQYLPAFLFKDKVFKTVNAADSKEHERLRLTIEDMLKQLNVETATWGLAKWEEMLGIVSEDDDIHNRRSEIIIRLNHKLASTPQFLERLANRWIMDNSAKITQHNEKYSFTLSMNKDNCYDLPAVKKAIEIYKPAHLGWEIHEILTVEQDLKFSGKVMLSEAMTLKQQTAESIEPLAGTLGFAGGVLISETINVGG